MAADAESALADATGESLLEGDAREALTVRAVALGLCAVVALDLIAIYVRYIYRASLMTYSHIPMSMLIAFTLLIMIGAVVTKLTGTVVSASEWHTVLIMSVVGGAVPIFGISGYVLSYMASPYYFATVDNEWDKYLHPYIPQWLVPSDEGKAATWFYEGVPGGADVPWGEWLLPLVWWTTMIVAAFVMLACVAVIFRRQWVQNERLAFPAMAPLIDMAAAPGDGKRWLPEFTGNYLFWIGFAVAFGMIAWNCINYFLPGFPVFPIYRGRWYWIDRQFPPIRGFIGMFSLFFSYFASLEVLFSVWFFDLLFIIEGGSLNKMGYSACSPYYYRGIYYWQTKGAFVVFVASVFWVARRHIQEVFLKAWKTETPIDDRDEWVSYRTAVIALAVSMVYMWIWLARIGFDVLQAIMLLFAVIFTYVGMAKILADTGIPYTNVPAGPYGLVSPFFGSAMIDSNTRVALRFSSRITSHYKGLFLPALSHAGRITEGVRFNRRHLMIAIFLAFVVSFGVCILLTLYLGYRDGAYNFGSWEIVWAGQRHFKGTAAWVKRGLTEDASPPVYVDHPDYMAFFAVGGALMASLIYLRYRFTWWPLHPVGLSISGSYLARRTACTIFAAWLIKLVMLKVGGPGFYRKSRPFFVGLLVGYVLGIALSSGIDVLWFPDRGHYVHRY